jgi:anaerobic magnesium-protoporphyrin IX monomethyl ester cyclase
MGIQDARFRNPRFLCCYPPLQYTTDELIRPDGTLALPYLDAALAAAGYHSDILDMSIGRPGTDNLKDTFFRIIPLPEVSSEMVRIGMSDERIIDEVADYDVIAVTSIFTQQTSRCLALGRLIKSVFPEKILIAGGVNARSLREHFFNNGYDLVCLSEGEKPVVALAHYLRSGAPALDQIPAVSYRIDGKTVVNPTSFMVEDLDEYPIPSWEKLPNEQYWEINRLWGGKTGWLEGQNPRYAAIFTSRGCPFSCRYCHISGERGGEAGQIGSLRLHSVERVEQELVKLKGLGVELVYINDDSFLAKKPRVHEILKRIRKYDFLVADVNGVNIIHLHKREGGRLVVDVELLEALYEAGFRRLGLPFESGTQRLLDKYSTSKWDIDTVDPIALIRTMEKMGFTITGNFMIGYPDEQLDELTNTFLLAKRAMDAGLTACGFFMVQPFPGTALFDESIASGQLPSDWHWDQLGWSKQSPFKNLPIDRDLLKYTWSLVFRLLNREERNDEWSVQMKAARTIYATGAERRRSALTA